MTASEIIETLTPLVPDVPFEALSASDEALNPTILVPVEHLLATCLALRDTPGLEFVAFSDVTAADFHPHRNPRYDVVYHFVSPHRRARVRLKVRVHLGDPVPTISTVWKGAGWPEREVYDLFGIVFEGHPDLRRLLMPEDWEGHPLRKDYPVQVKTPVTFDMPTQVTEEEFVRNIESRRVRTRRP